MMKKYRATKMAKGGKTPTKSIVPDPKRMPTKVMVSGSQDTTATKPPVKLQGVTVVAKKGEGIKTMSFGTKDFAQRQSDLMGIEVSKFMEGKPKSYKISDAERSNIKDNVRAELRKGGQQYSAPAFRDTKKPLTAAEIAQSNRIDEEKRKKAAAAAAPRATAPFSQRK